MKRLTFIVGILFLASCNVTDSNKTRTLSLSVDPVAGGTLSPMANTVQDGSIIELTASPNEHWVFDRWSGDYDGVENPLTITVTRDIRITAHFIKRDYPLQVIVEGEGTFSEEIIHVSAVQSDYEHGTLVRLTALPADGWQVGFWGGDADGNASEVEVMVDGPTTVRLGFFELPQFHARVDVAHPNAFYSLVGGSVINKEGITYVGMGHSHYTVGLIWDDAEEISGMTNEGVLYQTEGDFEWFKLENLDAQGRYFARFRAENQFGVFYSDAVEINVPKYNYGGLGQAEGTVFFVDKDDEYRFDYLEMALPGWHSSAPDGDPQAVWGCSGVRIFTDDNDQPGRANGLASTRRIADECAVEGRLVLDYDINGYTDWYLPTAMDTHEFYVNLSGLPVPDSPGVIVTTSESGPTEYIYWGSGRVGSYVLKSNIVSVRPIRAFSD